MKIRNGFVSNSSSSSFCIIGTEHNIDEIAKEEKVTPDDFGHGVAEGKHLEFYGNPYEDEWSDTVVGISAEKILETMTLPQAKQYVHDELLKHTGVNVLIENVELLYGQRGND